MNVLVFTGFDEKNSVFMLRLGFFFDYFKEKNYVKNVYFNDLEKINSADIVIVHRFVSLSGFVIRNILKAEIPVIIETDDLLMEVDETHPHFDYAFKSNMLWNIYRNISSGYTVSTEYLREYFLKYENNTVKIKNTLPFINKRKESAHESRFRIAFVGTPTHEADFAFLKEPLKEILKLNVEILCFGFLPEFLEECEKVKFYPFERDYLKSLKRFKDEQIDLGLAPLQINSFNKAKSSIKYVEYTWAEIAGIYTDIEPYRGIRGGLVLKNDPEIWYEHILDLKNNRGKTETILSLAKKQIREEYDFKREAEKLWTFYKKTAENFRSITVENLVESLERGAEESGNNLFTLYTYLQALKTMNIDLSEYSDFYRERVRVLNPEDLSLKDLIALFLLFILLDIEYTESMREEFVGRITQGDFLRKNFALVFFLTDKMFASARVNDVYDIYKNIKSDHLINLPDAAIKRGLLFKMRVISEMKREADREVEELINIFNRISDKEKLSDVDLRNSGMINFYAAVYYTFRGLKSRSDQNYCDALGFFEKIHEKKVLDYYRSASIFRDLHEYEKALLNYREAARITLSSDIKSSAFFNIGLILFNRSKNNEAEDAFLKCLELNPSHRKAREYSERCREEKI